MEAAATAPLAGLTVGVTADRRADDQAVMFERLGAEVLLGPALSTHKLPDPDALRARTEALAADPPDYVIANTGIGMRTWLSAAAGWGLEEPLQHALAATRLVARGPKAAGALSSAGLKAWWRSPTEQLSDLLDHLEQQGLEGRTVAFQLHGDDGREVVDRLEGAGATVTTMPVYVWGPPTDPGPATELIRRCCDGELDALTFTAGPQVRALIDLATAAGLGPRLLETLDSGRVVVGCIGPVCAAVAAEAGIGGLVVPDHWRLGSLVKVVTAALTARG